MTRLAALALALTLAACAPLPQPGPTGTPTPRQMPTCGAGNPLCADGGRPLVIVLPDGTTGLAPSGYVAPKGGF